MKYLLFLFPIFLQAQCLIPTHSYRLVCADEVRYADSTSIGSRLYISSRNAFVTSPRSVFSLVNGYGQHFIQITNSANSQKVAINRAWINRIDSTSSNKALIYIKDISVTFTTTESYTAVKDSAIACFVRSVASGLATLSDGDYGDVIVSGGGLVMTVDKPDQGLHNLADGDFSVAGDSTALSLTNVRRISLLSKTIDGWLSRYLQENNQITLRTQSSSKVSRIFIDTTGANFQFVNGSNNASLRIGDSVAVRFNTSGSVGQVLTVTSVDGDGRLVINPKTGGSGTANCEQTITKASHGFSKWAPIYWNGSAWARPTFDSIIPTYIVVDSTSVNTFKVSNCGNYSSTLTAGLYYYKGASPGYSLTPTSIPTPLFEVAQARLILQPLVGFRLAGGAGDVTSAVLADTAAAIRADFPSGGTLSGTARVVPYLNDAGRAVLSNTYFRVDTTTSAGDLARMRLNINKTFDISTPDGYTVLDVFSGDAAETGGNMFLSDQTLGYVTAGYDPRMVLYRYGGSLNSASNIVNGNLLGRYGFGGYVNGTRNNSLSGIFSTYLGDGTTQLANLDGRISGGTIGWRLDETAKFWLGTNGAGYYFPPSTAPSITSGVVNTLRWTGNGSSAVPSFLRSQYGVATGTTDGSGDLTVTFAAAMPDATYSLIATAEGTTYYTTTVHTKATGTVKVRFFDATGAAVAGASVTISYEAKDY